MAIYYIRQSGSDSNSGLTPALAWRTLGKALGAAGISSGDTVYVGAGVYREAIIVSMTSATVETSIIGDVDGSKTGDAGEVQLTGLLNQDIGQTNNTVIHLNGRDFLTFLNIVFICSPGGTNGSTDIIYASTATSINIKFINCAFYQHLASGSSACISITVGFGVSANWIIDKCLFLQGSSSNGSITIFLTTGVGNDYDSNINITNCSFLTAIGVLVTSSGTSANEGGGVNIVNCFFFGGIAANTTTLRVGGYNFIFPVTIRNCFCFRSVGNTSILLASELGNLIEDNNVLICSTPRTNVNAGPRTIANNDLSPLFSFGQEKVWNGKLVPFGTFLKRSPILGWGDNSIAPINDNYNNPRSCGSISFFHNGTVTSATATTLTDTSKNFGDKNTLAGYTMKILDGPGRGETKTIRGNSPNLITGNGQWINIPTNNSKYVIYQGQTSTNSLVSSGTITTLTDNYVNWELNFWRGYTCIITSGIASGQNFIISGNSRNILTGYFPMSIIPSSGDVYELFLGAMARGVVSTGSAYTVTDNLASWQQGILSTGFWINNWRCMIYEGVASGQNFAISGNDARTLSGWNSLSIVPASGDKYVIFQNTGNLTGYYPANYYPPYSRDYIQTSVGCYSVTDTAIKETGIVLSGSNSIRLFGPACQDFQIPVSGNVTTTLNVFGYYDEFYSGVKPQLIVKNGEYLGVNEVTGTMVGGSGQWEQISVSFYASGNGVVTARLMSNCTSIGGSCFFDAYSIS